MPKRNKRLLPRLPEADRLFLDAIQLIAVEILEAEAKIKESFKARPTESPLERVGRERRKKQALANVRSTSATQRSAAYEQWKRAYKAAKMEVPTRPDRTVGRHRDEGK